MTEVSAREELSGLIDTIESAYEFLLAYAAQGRRTDRGAGDSEGPRPRLEATAGALTRLPAVARQAFAAASPDAAADCGAFLDAFERDAEVAAAQVRLVLHQSDISSQLIDNLNASIHLRALLTDIFLVDESLKS